LPIAALEAKMVFPSFIILDENKKVIAKITGYKTPELLEPLLHYYAEDKYKKMTFEKFKENFKGVLDD